jgi:CMP-N-acetylneuraminic acid synthetase
VRMGIIPARGGSKGIPGKNIKELCGKPLIAWTIEAAKKSKLLDRTLVSTDCEDISRVAGQFGAEVLQRPEELATDESTTISVLEHIARQFPEVITFVVLQPTSPLRDEDLIDECIRDYEKGDFTNLATGFWCKYQEFGTHNNSRRQDCSGFFYDDGNVYVLDKALVEKGLWFGNKISRKVIRHYQNYEIDEEVDLVVLEALMKKYGSDSPPKK